MGAASTPKKHHAETLQEVGHETGIFDHDHLAASRCFNWPCCGRTVATTLNIRNTGACASIEINAGGLDRFHIAC